MSSKEKAPEKTTEGWPKKEQKYDLNFQIENVCGDESGNYKLVFHCGDKTKALGIVSIIAHDCDVANTEDSRNNFYLIFKSKEAAIEALQRHGKKYSLYHVKPYVKVKKSNSYDPQKVIETLVPGFRGSYALFYRKKEEDKTIVLEDLRKKFSECGELEKIDAMQGRVVICYKERAAAIKAVEKFGSELKLKMFVNSQMYREMKKKGEIPKEQVEVYIGNMAAGTSKTEVEEFLSSYDYFYLKMNKISSDPSKRFISAFVKFDAEKIAEAEKLIKDKNKKTWKGKKLYVGFAKQLDKGSAAVQNQDSQSQKEEDGEKLHDFLDGSKMIPKMLPSRMSSHTPESSTFKPWWKKSGATDIF